MLKQLFEHSSDAILLLDRGGRFIDGNAAALALLKMSRVALLSATPADISPVYQPGGRRSDELVPELIAQANASGFHRFDWVCVNAEGDEFVVEVTLMPIVIDGNTLLYSTWRDVTERIQTERNLRNALMFMPVPIGVTNQAGDILLFNEAFSAVFGYGLDDLTSVDVWFSLAYPDPVYRAEVLATWSADVAASLVSGLPTPRREYRVTARSGDVRRVVITMRPIEDLVVTTFEDITQRLRDEEELAQYRVHLEQLVDARTRELAEKNRALEAALQQLQAAQAQLVQESKLSSLGQLVAGIAHELNTPIGNARTLSSTLVNLGQAFVHRLDEAEGLRKSDLKAFVGQVAAGGGCSNTI